MSITYRIMEMEDVPAAVELEQLCFSEPWSEEAYHATLLLPYALYVAAVDEGRLIGMCGVRMIAGEGDITNVAVHPRYRGRHVANGMLLFLTQQARLRGTEAFTLEVRSGNAPAIALYRRLGFVQEGIRRGFYDKPKEDALIMWLR